VGEKAKAAVAKLKNGDILVLENTRFHAGEEANDPDFAKQLASLGDIYVNDAFSAAHRAHASTEGLAHLLPHAAGRSMQAELEHLHKALGDPMHPVMAVVGGAKVSTKIELLNNLLTKVDVLAIGGAMANTFLAAEGRGVGKSLYEENEFGTARTIVSAATDAGTVIMLPSDVVVAKELKEKARTRITDVFGVKDDEMILDIGPTSVQEFTNRLLTTATVVWNGPLGAFETPPFDQGTIAAAKAVAARTKEGRLISVAGGGDTVAALNKAGVANDFTYVSTAGGAFLEWLEGKDLPGVAALEQGN
jgi:phosphoglycerate kinase